MGGRRSSPPTPSVRAALTLALWVLAAGQPIAGYVFVLDGVLIGAGDAQYLAIAGVVNLAVYLPLLLAVGCPGPAAARGCSGCGRPFRWATWRPGPLTLGLRARTDRWMVLGAR